MASDIRANNALSHSHNHLNTYTSPPLMQRSNASQLDEGYAGEETRSLTDSEMICASDMEGSTQQALNMLLALTTDQRRLVLEAGIRSMSSADKEALGAYCSSLTHFDPETYLPAELMLSVLAYLTPQDLLTTSSVSRAWRERSHDEKLWRSLFAQEGWVLDRGKLDAFEQSHKGRAKKGAESGRTDLERRGSRKRKTEEAFSEGEGGVQLGSPQSAGTSMRNNASEASGDGMEGV